MGANPEGRPMTAAVRIRTTLTSDTPHLPELGPLVGQAVEIVVTPQPAERPPPGDRPPTPEELAVREDAMTFLRNSTYDWDAWKVQREIDLRHEEEELRKWQQNQGTEGQS